MGESKRHFRKQRKSVARCPILAQLRFKRDSTVPPSTEVKATAKLSRFFVFLRHRGRRIVSPPALLFDGHPMGTQEGERGEAVRGPGPGPSVSELATRSQSLHVHWLLQLTSAFWWTPSLLGCQNSLLDYFCSGEEWIVTSGNVCFAVKLIANKVG